MSGTRWVPADFVDLALTYLARSRRRKLGGAGGVESEEFYEEFFSEVETAVLSQAADPRKRMRFDGVCDAVARYTRPGAALLDVGCGRGDNLLSLLRVDGLILHGVEYARSNVERARILLGSKAAIVRGSALALPYPAQSFDVVTCLEVLEHLTDDGGALDEQRRVLRSDGVVVITVPYRHWFPAYRTLIGHERHYDRSGLVSLLSDHGFDVEEYIPNFPQWHRAADYAYVLCRIAGIIAGRFGGEGLPHRVQLPWVGRPMLEVLSRALQPLRVSESRLDYSTLPSSTSVVARKR